MIRRLKKQRGFTLVELMIVVAIIGILAALAVYGVKRYITSSKTAEAKEILGRLGKDGAAAYQRENMVGSILADDGSVSASHDLCPTAPMTPGAVPSNMKVQTKDADWRLPGWTCLRFSIAEPTYYAYGYTQTDTSNFVANAFGNLDGDGDTATFAYAGRVESGAVRLAPTISEDPNGFD